MMRCLFIITTIYFFSNVQSQCTLTLQPGPQDGKDAWVFGLGCNTSYGISSGLCDTTKLERKNYSSCKIKAWTYGGSFGESRTFMEFDLSSLLNYGCGINEAYLILSHPQIGDDHCGQNSGWNACLENSFIIEKVNEYWDEYNMNWVNQPSISTNSSISISDSSSQPYADYKIDVSSFVNYWIAHPDSNFGLRLKLTQESQYKSVLISTSDHSNYNLRPKLILTLNCDTTHCNNTISGNIYDDVNSNCTLETTDIGLEDWYVKIEPGPIYATSDQFGNWSANVDQGNYTVTPINKNTYLWSDSCAPSYTVNFTTADTTATNIDFPMQASNYCADLWVDIGVTRMRKCHNEWFKVMYCNKGNVAEDSVYIDVSFDDFIIPQGASVPYTLNPDSSLHFDIGTLQPYECGFFTVTTLIDCNVEFGTTQCASATIYPQNICEIVDTNWDNSSVMVTGGCDGDSLVCFTIFNTGNAGGGDMQTSSTWRLYEDNVMIQTGSFQLNGQDSLVLCFAANGHTLRLEADQHPLHPGNSHPRESIESCGSDTTITVVPLTSVADDDMDAFTETICEVIVASYDPNEKVEKPLGVTDNKYISKNDELEYTVHFQNTGNAPALLVVVKDTLSEFLDPATLVSGVSSHNYQYNIKGDGIVEWRFDGINLIDSTTDEPNSHGYVKFKIQQQPNNPKGTLIQNRVGIYFDFNAPVITEFVWNIVWDSSTTSIPEVIREENINVLVYPNPANNVLNFRFNDRNKHTITILNLVGQKVKSEYNAKRNTSMDISNLSQGVYLYQITNSVGDKAIGKFVKE